MIGKCPNKKKCLVTHTNVRWVTLSPARVIFRTDYKARPPPPRDRSWVTTNQSCLSKVGGYILALLPWPRYIVGYRREYRDGAVARARQAAADRCCMVGKRYGNYLFVLYMIVKFCYVAVALIQLYGLNFVIGRGKHCRLHFLSNNLRWKSYGGFYW